jgi:hypothetical protein
VFTQEQFNSALADERRKWKAAQDEAARKIKQDADDKAAQEKGEFEKLANDRQARITVLEQEQASAGEQLTALQEAMEKQIKARIRALPEELRDMIPETADVLTRYELVGKAEAAAAKLGKPAIPSTPPGPRGSGAQPPVGQAPDVTAQKRASGEYAI